MYIYIYIRPRSRACHVEFTYLFNWSVKRAFAFFLEHTDARTVHKRAAINEQLRTRARSAASQRAFIFARVKLILKGGGKLEEKATRFDTWKKQRGVSPHTNLIATNQIQR